MKKYFFLLIPLAFLWLALGSGCKKKELCAEYADRQRAWCNLFYIVDKNTGEDLVGTSGKRYHPDSIKMKEAFVFIPNYSYEKVNYNFDSYGKYRFMGACPSGFLQEGNTYYLRLNKDDIDTIRIEKIDAVSKVPCTAVLNFYHNERLVMTHDYSYDEIPELKIKK